MFGKMMNNYYYGKSGKGDYRKEDLPHNRWQLFFEMLRIRFSALVRLNLMYMLIWLPTMIVLMMGAMGMLSSLSDSLTGADQIATFELDGSDRYLSGGHELAFSAFEKLYGGALADVRTSSIMRLATLRRASIEMRTSSAFCCART